MNSRRPVNFIVGRSRKMKLARFTAILILLAAQFSAVLGVQKTDPFALVPAVERDRLKMRLAEFVEFHRTKQWERVYDLLAERTKHAAKGGLPKDIFLRKRLYSTVKKFTPKYIQKINALDSWMIEGCATYDDGDTMESAVEAYEQNCDWFFSDIWSSAPCVDCKPRSCNH